MVLLTLQGCTPDAKGGWFPITVTTDSETLHIAADTTAAQDQFVSAVQMTNVKVNSIYYPEKEDKKHHHLFSRH